MTAIKAETMRRLTADRPEVERVTTTAASDNVPMKAVNRSIGYTGARGLGHFEASLAELTARLAG